MTQMQCATVQRADGRRVESTSGKEEEEGDGFERSLLPFGSVLMLFCGGGNGKLCAGMKRCL